MKFIYLLFWGLTCFSVFLAPAVRAEADTEQNEPRKQGSGNQYQVGAERPDKYLPYLAGKRVGLVVNQASYTGQGHTIDQLIANGVDIELLFALEHGIRGTEDAGAIVADGIDPLTGIPVRSLYGKSKKPSADDLRHIDVIIYDVQDVGVRFFTYISSLHYLMEACAEEQVPLLVFDRPNPNGDLIDGPVLDTRFQSFVGMHPIPVLYGLTPGELATMINAEGWLGYGQHCALTVVPLANYHRGQKVNTLRRPSPNLPNEHAIKLYPSLALFEATDVSVGRGTLSPFQVVGGPDHRLGEFRYKPLPIPGMAMQPKHNGIAVFGEDLRTRNLNNGVDIEYFLKWSEKYKEIGREFLVRPEWLDKLMGTDEFRLMIEEGRSAQEIRATWADDLRQFQNKRMKYLMYTEDK